MFLVLSSIALGSNCDRPYTVDELLADISRAEDALRLSDEATAAEAAAAALEGLACLDQPLQGAFAGRAFRTIGSGLMGVDGDQGLRWLAAGHDPNFSFGVGDMAEDHVARRAYMGFGDGRPVAVHAQGDLVAGTHLLDGRRLTEPVARPDANHLYQFTDEAGTLRSWLIVGAAFPRRSSTSMVPPRLRRRRVRRGAWCSTTRGSPSCPSTTRLESSGGHAGIPLWERWLLWAVEPTAPARNRPRPACL